MSSRENFLKILDKYFENKNLVKHMLATEAAMGGLYDYFKSKRPEEVKEPRQEWTTAGLLHDLDYQDNVPIAKHGLVTPDILAREGVTVPETVLRAIAAHNWKNTRVMPQTLMEWSLFGCDELTGLIVATTLVLPSRKLVDVKTKNVLNRFREKSFARGVNRDDVRLGAEKLGLPVEELVEIVLKAMQSISQDLGL